MSNKLSRWAELESSFFFNSKFLLFYYIFVATAVRSKLILN